MPEVIMCHLSFSAEHGSAAARKIINELKTATGCYLYDYEYRRDNHGYEVVYFGDREAILKATIRATHTATELIDMREYSFNHTAIGSMDTVSFVPITGVSMDVCIEMAIEYGSSISSELQIPIYLYSRSAQYPERQKRLMIRRGGYCRLLNDITSPERCPDFGAAIVHPTAGAIIVGATPMSKSFGMTGSDITTALAVYEAHKAAGAIRDLGRSRGSRGAAGTARSFLKAAGSLIYSLLVLIRPSK